MKQSALQETCIRMMKHGDVVLTMNHGSGISQVIGTAQGRPWNRMRGRWDPRLGKPIRPLPKLSHGAFYYGGGVVVEQTWPKGGLNPMVRYLDPDHTTFVFVPRWSQGFRERVCGEAYSLAGYEYATGNLGLHLLDNLIERLTWRESKQRGSRPLMRLLDGETEDTDNVCTEMMGRAYFRVAQEPLDPNVLAGKERPLDWFIVAREEKWSLLYLWHRGLIYYTVPKQLMPNMEEES